MVFNRKYPLIQVFIIMTVGLGEEFRFPLPSYQPSTIKSYHWQYPESNSAMDRNGIEIDVFQWQAAADKREAVHVAILNSNWEDAGWISDNIVLPETILISKVLNFRGTPTVYIKVTPWRNVGNRVEVLSGGEIRIWVEPTNFPVTFSHPYLLNGEKHMLKRTSADATEYLIICPDYFESSAQSLADMHTNLVDDDYRLKTEVVVTDDISDNPTGLALRNYIINRINLDSDNNLKF